MRFYVRDEITEITRPLFKFIANIFTVNIPQNRNFGLDVLRALAILFVLYSHSLMYLQELLPLGFLSRFMFDGVSVFFVLSGFLIGQIFIQEIRQNGTATKVLLWFWFRRWMRTLPAYFFVLTGLLLFYHFFRKLDGIAWGEYYLFVQNMFTPHPNFYREAWSLSIEEWFYLIFPFFTWGIARLSKLKLGTIILLVSVSIILSTLYFRWEWIESVSTISMKEYNQWLRTRIVTRFDGLMIGVLLSAFYIYFPTLFERHKKLMLFFGICFLGLYYFTRLWVQFPWVALLNLTFISVGVALSIPFLMGVSTRFSWWQKAVTFVSLTSYSAYLINYAIVADIFIYNGFKPIVHWFNTPVLAMLKYVAFYGFTFLFSAALYNLVERPFIRWRNKISPKKEKI